jgi:hypothetical protein
LAFDAAGNLWVNYDGTLARLDAAGLADTGATTVTPAVQITLDVLSLPQGVAFDEGGGLWLAYTAGKLARLGPTQLTSSGSKAPEIVIASPDFGYATWVGIYPAPAALPLYHRLPYGVTRGSPNCGKLGALDGLPRASRRLAQSVGWRHRNRRIRPAPSGGT